MPLSDFPIEMILDIADVGMSALARTNSWMYDLLINGSVE
jgi:hypothetical protein